MTPEGEDIADSQNNLDSSVDGYHPSNSQPEESNVAPPAQVAEPVQTPQSQPATAEQLRGVQREMNGFESSTLLFAKLAFGVSLVAAIFVGLQWQAMRDTLDEMKRSGNTSTDQIWRAIDNMNWTARIADTSLHQNKDAMDAQYGILSAQLNVTRENFEKAMRPHVNVTNPVLPNGVSVNQPLIVSIDIVNSGQTEAVVVIKATLVTVPKSVMISMSMNKSGVKNRQKMFDSIFGQLPASEKLVVAKEPRKYIISGGVTAADFKKMFDEGGMAIYVHGTAEQYSDAFGKYYEPVEFCFYYGSETAAVVGQHMAMCTKETTGKNK